MFFQGLQNRQQHLGSAWLAKITIELGGVTNLLFRWFLIFAEATVLLNAVDEEQGQPPPDAVFHGLQNCQQHLGSAWLAKIATDLGSVTNLLFRWFLIFAEATVLLNAVDEEQRQGTLNAGFEGYEITCSIELQFVRRTSPACAMLQRKLMFRLFVSRNHGGQSVRDHRICSIRFVRVVPRCDETRR